MGERQRTHSTAPIVETSRLIQRRVTSFYEFGLSSPPLMAYTLSRTRSLPPHLLHHAHQRHDADDQAYYERSHTQRPLDLLLQGGNHANHWRGYADDGLENVVDVEVVTPDEFRKIIHAAPMHLIPLLAISAFAGIRSAELGRLDWNAVDRASSSV